jgi:predicted naringenin-chalcone synthase
MRPRRNDGPVARLRAGPADHPVRAAQIEHRYSCLEPAADPASGSVDAGGLFRRGAFASTGARMKFYEEEAPALAAAAVDALELGQDARRITHVIATTCTGLSAPGIDFEVIRRCGLDPTVERTVVGFMGCHAGISALKLARHIVRSEPAARVLVVNVELCTLHLQETPALEQLLAFLIFADGAAASLVTSEPYGLALDRFETALLPDTAGLITWQIRDAGFDMLLSGRVPGALREGLALSAERFLAGRPARDIDHWAVHPGGRTILDAAEQALDLDPTALGPSRDVLRDHGNMSSASVMFVLERLMRTIEPGASGCAMAFGPGLTAETLLFHAAG